VPQFDTSTFLPQLFWLSLIFGVLYFFVVRPTLPKVGRVIDERETRVKDDLDAAEAARGAADAVRHAYDEGMAAARKTAQAEVAAARAAAAQAAEARMTALAAELDGKTDAAMASLATAREAARAALAATAADLTADAVRRLAGIDVAPADVEAALAEGVRHG
jgi:F-type H+-transporting ATPase subunit b